MFSDKMKLTVRFSNACKFTPAGGQLTVTTRLILPHRNGTSRQDSDTLTATEMSKEAKEIISVTPLVDEPTDSESRTIFA